ncbi:hypothetical protein B0A78_12655 [Flavobacterium columnare NBRC 100251 = ATCC 23463]|uniref:2TM domain-containing protein n=1 Tax=Flavobacterium columnare (strain ATCC 49512 / CIP 103533 / TG 44/87) TaxID=1041826 RepID=G8X4I3_FLACA|nr:2TM domain-containing protein [Flavobacterium columnare]AEW85408.1 hypothetical protein FCOL_02815 [Flavobacterium columnare ATCC 49512]ANO48807.1 hypothetical protein Pf1_00559 [Flavobacterium columnare]APT23165.1 hypothetical protein BU993_11390 [Flavobacterium columnare]MBF6652371.1 hypothetical protein [Flavobacterium columnare]MBF6654122.1 hypothetical protein [Flavobacterium columnare]
METREEYKKIKHFVPTNEEESRYLEAYKQVKKIKGFYTHLIIYIFINTILYIANIQNVKENESYLEWHYFYTAFFWGIGLLAHGLSVFLPNMILGSRWEQKKIQELMKQEQQNQKQWN